LVVVSVILAEKCYEEEETELEAYSLTTGVPIKHLAALEERILTLVDYRLLVREKDFELFAKGDIDSLFLERSNQY
jgi:hypothetical protein